MDKNITTFESPMPSTQNTPFVGRKEELQYLQQIFNTAIKSNTPKFAFIQGDFGVGKTALVERFLSHLVEEQPTILVGKGICVSETEMSGLVPFHHLLESIGKQNKLQKIIQSDYIEFLKNIAPAWLDIFTGGILGATIKTLETTKQLSSRSGYRQEHVFLQFTHLLMKLAENCPLVMFLDDLQWADISSLELLAHLASTLKERRILCICAYRPEAKETGTNAAKFNEVYQRILRNELRGELKVFQGIDVVEYVNQRYLHHTFSTEFLARIQTQTEGHPLFVSQLFSLWQELRVIKSTPGQQLSAVWKVAGGVNTEPTLPNSLRVVLEQRLRLMGEELRKVATSASIEGEEFTAQIVARLSKIEESDIYDHLHTLEHNYWLIQEYETKEFGETVIDIYKFMHRFFREYIYEQLDTGKRRNLHKAVGEGLEALYSQNLYPIAGQLVTHFREARLLKKAVKYMLLAAQYEQSHYTWTEAENWCVLGLNLLENMPDDAETTQLRFDLLLQSGAGQDKSGNLKDAEQRYQEALSIVHKININPEELIELYIELADITKRRNYPKESLPYIEQGQKVLLQHLHTVPYGEIHLKLAWIEASVQNTLGQFDQGRERLLKLLQEAESLPQTLTLDQIMACIYLALSAACNGLDLYEDDIVYTQKAIDLTEKIGEKALQSEYMSDLAVTYFCIGKFEDGLMTVSKAIVLSSQIGALESLRTAKSTKGRLLVAIGNISEALQELHESETLANQLKMESPSLLRNLALAYLELHDLEKAHYYASESLSMAEKMTRPMMIANSLDTLGEVEVARQHIDIAIQHFKNAISIYEQVGDRHYAARSRSHLAHSFILQGNHVEAKSLLHQAISIFQELKLQYEVIKAEQLLNRVSS